MNIKDTAVAVLCASIAALAIIVAISVDRLADRLDATIAALPAQLDTALTREVKASRERNTEAIAAAGKLIVSELDKTRANLGKRVDDVTGRLDAQLMSANMVLAGIGERVDRRLETVTANLKPTLKAVERSATNTADITTLISLRVPSIMDRWETAGKAFTAAVPGITTAVQQIAANSAKVTGDAATVSAKVADPKKRRWWWRWLP